MKQLIAARKRLRLSQRTLAARAGIAYKSLQLVESGRHNPSLELLEKIARALQLSGAAITTHMDNFFADPADSVRAASRTLAHQGNTTWQILLFNCVDAIRRTKDSLYYSNPPVKILPEQLRALFASTVESLCAELELTTPAWCATIPSLSHPWFVADIENLKASALVESPIHFRKRNIFVLANFLERR